MHPHHLELRCFIFLDIQHSAVNAQNLCRPAFSLTTCARCHELGVWKCGPKWVVTSTPATHHRKGAEPNCQYSSTFNCIPEFQQRTCGVISLRIYRWIQKRVHCYSEVLGKVRDLAEEVEMRSLGHDTSLISSTTSGSITEHYLQVWVGRYSIAEGMLAICKSLDVSPSNPSRTAKWGKWTIPALRPRKTQDQCSRKKDIQGRES